MELCIRKEDSWVPGWWEIWGVDYAWQTGNTSLENLVSEERRRPGNSKISIKTKYIEPSIVPAIFAGFLGCCPALCGRNISCFSFSTLDFYYEMMIIASLTLKGASIYCLLPYQMCFIHSPNPYLNTFSILHGWDLAKNNMQDLSSRLTFLQGNNI